MKSRLFIAVITAVLALGLVPALVMAQDQQAEPTSGVARVSLINGDVSTQRGDSGDWVATAINAPLVLGDRIATGNASRTEVQLDFANVLRLDQNSQAKIADLTRGRIQLQLAQGTMDYSVFKDSQADAEIDTPNVAVQPTGEGQYRIQVNSAAETQVIVRSGEAQVSTPQGSTTVKQGEMITVEGQGNPEYQIAQAPARDQWDDWNRERDDAILNAQNYTHTNRYYTGSQDLDQYGHWVYVPGNDWCWTPYVNLGWVPYRDGRWIWEPYWGWTWVSYEPWGWAPYHYGRWFVYGSSWYWWPGYVTPAYYPVWAPAYVSFIGFGYGRYNFGFGYGYGFSSIGWLPLGPYDRVHGWWGRGRSYNVVNITNITNVTNVTNVRNGRGTSNFQGAFTNARVREGITTVSTQDFVSGRMPGRFNTIDQNALRQGRVVQGTLPVVPTRQSLTPVNRPAVVPASARAGAARQTFYTPNRPPAGPERFSDRATQIRQMVQQPRSLEAASQANGAARAGANLQDNRAAAIAGHENTTTGFEARTANRANGPAASAAARPANAANARTPATVRPQATQAQGRAVAAEANSNWRRFGERGPAKAPAQVSASPVQAPAGNNRPERQAQPQLKSQPAPAAANREAPNSGWNRFGSANSRQTAPQSATPRSIAAPQSQAAPRNSSSGTAPAARNESSSRSGGFTPFTRQAQPAPRPAPAPTETTRPGWNQFPSNSGGQAAPRNEGNRGWSQPAPRAIPRSESPVYRSSPSRSERPALQISKPIVVQRAPRSYEPRSAPRGGGRSAPAKSSGNGDHHRH
jgi:Family of unknown function (DUF6600)/FecR protein